MKQLDNKSLPRERRARPRIELRFDKAFVVIVDSELYGQCVGVARNISLGGMMVEMVEPLPLGSFVTIHFRMPDCPGHISVRSEVKHHYCLNFNHHDEPNRVRAMGLRFAEFVEESAEKWGETFARRRVLH